MVNSTSEKSSTKVSQLVDISPLSYLSGKHLDLDLHLDNVIYFVQSSVVFIDHKYTPNTANI